MDFKDYYTILGASRNASEKDIKQAYRKLARQYHPDVNPNDKNAEARFREINEAYTVLSDPEKRRRYDELGANWDKVQERTAYGQSPQGGAYTFHFSTGSENLGEFFGGGFSDFFRTFFGGGEPEESPFFGHRARPEPELFELPVTLEEVYHGLTKSFLLPIPSLCSRCMGKGTIRRNVCPVCQGQGKIFQKKNVEVRIPKGVPQGQVLRLRPEGQEIHLKVKYLPHPRFQVKPNGDFTCELSVPFLSCVLGGEIEIPTLKGKTMMKVPPRTQNGAVLRLRGLGMPGNGKSGDLFVTLKALLPASVTAEEKRLYEELQELSHTKTKRGGESYAAR